MFLGNPMMMKKQGYSVDYASFLAGITGKVAVLRGDQSTAPNGGILNTYPWDNEASATEAIGNPTWVTNAQNGFRGVSSTAFVNTQLALNNITTKGFTVFAVEKRSGLGGNNETSARYLNNGVVNDAGGYWGIHFEKASRQFNFYTYGSDYNYVVSGLSYNDNQPYVLAVRVINSDGSVRFNFNGTVASFPSAAVPAPSDKTGFIRFANDKTGIGPIYGFEYILANQEIGDADMDAFVVALKNKWAIT